MKQAKDREPPRFFLQHSNSPGQVFDLSDDLMHHASRVLRLRNGQAVRVWNGQGLEFKATLHYLSKKLAQVHIQETLPIKNTELSQEIYVLQAMPEGDKMDWVLEKCTELGAAGFYPVQAQRSVVKLSGQRAEKRHIHWERVVLAASLQSERNVLALVQTVNSLPSTLQNIGNAIPNAQVLWFTPEAEQSLKQWIGSKKASSLLNSFPLVVCVGPEGGWTSEETSIAAQMGAVPLTFSQRVLRTETFAMACVAQLTALLDLETG